MCCHSILPFILGTGFYALSKAARGGYKVPLKEPLLMDSWRPGSTYGLRPSWRSG